MFTMIAVVQRVLTAGVFIEKPPHTEKIDKGLCVFLGVEQGDDKSDAGWVAKKLANLRIFNDEEGKMNRSILEIEGELLLISQFTLVGDCAKGNRPSFMNAQRGELAEPLVDLVGNLLQERGVPVKLGVFGAQMRVEIENDGPVTLILKQD
jgi:D-tyrosyl-tRNA(Tyr) deacylase